VRGYLDMRRLDFLLRALSEDSDIVDARDVSALGKQASRTSMQWLIPHVGFLTLFVTPMRPALMDITTGVSLFLLCAAIAAMVALALYATLRNSFLQVIELVPPRIMTEVVLSPAAAARGAHPDAVRRARLCVDRQCARAPRGRAQPRGDRARHGASRLRATTRDARVRRPTGPVR
jgi:hypothetical protein